MKSNKFYLFTTNILNLLCDLDDISLFPVCSSCVPAGCDDATPPVEALADPVISLVTYVYLSVACCGCGVLTQTHIAVVRQTWTEGVLWAVPSAAV